MAATREEPEAVKRTFERQHANSARALADLLLTGNATLESHGMRDQLMGESFEAFIWACARECGLKPAQLNAAVRISTFREIRSQYSAKSGNKTTVNFDFHFTI